MSLNTRSRLGAVLLGTALLAAPIVGAIPAYATDSLGTATATVAAECNSDGTRDVTATGNLATNIGEGQMSVALREGEENITGLTQVPDNTTAFTITTTLAPGEHSLLVWANKGSRDPYTFTVTPDPVVVDKCGPKKVFVCKYVGKPNVDERLKDGKNPISVSVNAIPDYNGVGSYFADGQFRSFVLAEDVGQPDPNISKCPKPDGPPPVTKYTLEFTTTCVPGFASGNLFNDIVNSEVKPEGAATVASSISGNTVNITTTPKDASFAPKTPTDALTVVTDNGGNCGNEEPPADIKPVKVTSFCGGFKVHNPNGEDVVFLYSKDPEGLPEFTSVDVPAGKTITVETELTKVYWAASGKTGAYSGDGSFSVKQHDCESLPDACPDMGGYQPPGTDCTPVKDKCPKKDGMQGPKDSCDEPSDWQPPSEDDGDKGHELWVIAAFIGLGLLFAGGGSVAFTAARRTV